MIGVSADHPFRFAAFPRCASRSLSQLGILGERALEYHTPITAYPEYESYMWYALERDEKEWFESWWEIQKLLNYRNPGEFGLTFKSLEADYDAVHSENAFAVEPRRKGINAWVPKDFTASWPRALKEGRTLQAYCFGTIRDGVPCLSLPLTELDDFLAQKSIATLHLNQRAKRDF